MQIYTHAISRFLAILIFTALMLTPPWDALTGGFVDRAVYETYFGYEQSVLEYASFDTALDYLTNEYLWHFLLGYVIRDLGYQTDGVFYCISLAFLVLISTFFVRQAAPQFLILLCSPIIVDLAFSQLRLTLAISMVLAAYLSRSRVALLVAFAAASFVHTAMVLFGFMLLVAVLVSMRSALVLRTKLNVLLWLLAAGFLVSLVVSPLRSHVLGLVGDRRAEYSDLSSTWAFNLFWIGLLVVFSAQNRLWFRSWRNSYSVILLTLVAGATVFRGYSLRFLAASLPVLVLSILALPRSQRTVMLACYSAYLTLQWVYWLRLWPLLA